MVSWKPQGPGLRNRDESGGQPVSHPNGSPALTQLSLDWVTSLQSRQWVSVLAGENILQNLCSCFIYNVYHRIEDYWMWKKARPYRRKPREGEVSWDFFFFFSWKGWFLQTRISGSSKFFTLTVSAKHSHSRPKRPTPSHQCPYLGIRDHWAYVYKWPYNSAPHMIRPWARSSAMSVLHL